MSDYFTKKQESDDKIKKALEARKNRTASARTSSPSQKKDSDSRIEAALRARNERVQDSLPSTFSDIDSLMSKEIDFYNNTNPSYGNYDAVYQSQRERRVAISNLRNKVNAHRKYMKEDVADELISKLDKMEMGYNAYLYLSMYESEDAYIRGATEASGERLKRYEDNQKRIAELQSELDSIDYDWTDSSQRALARKSADRVKSIRNEIDALEADNRLYERGEGGYVDKTVDDYTKLSGNADFNAGSSKRNYSNPDAMDIRKADAMNDPSTWRWDAAGVYRDAFGNELAVDSNGNWYNPAANITVADKLGLYLGTSEGERSQVGSEGGDGIWASVMTEGYNGSWEYLSKDEIDIYYYLLNQSQETAYKYLSDMKVELNRRKTLYSNEEMAASYDEVNLLGKIAYNLATVPMQLVGGVSSTFDNAVAGIKGEEINPYSDGYSGLHFSQTIRGETAKDLDATGLKIPVVDFTLGDAYQSGMSMLDSSLAKGIAGKLGGLLLAPGAASNEAMRLYQQGASSEQIAWGSAAAAAAEMVFESVSIDRLISMKNSKTIKQAIINALIQSGVEASEEGTTEIANILTNAVIMSGQSDWNKLVQEHNGSKLDAFLEEVRTVTHSSIAGFVSGGGAGSIQAGTSYAGEKIQEYADTQDAGRTIMGADGGVKALMDLANEVSGVSSTKMQTTLSKQSGKVGKKATAGRVGQLLNTVRTANDLANASANQADIAKSLSRKGFASETANDIAAALVARYNGQEITKAQQKLLESVMDNSAVRDVIENIVDNTKSTMGQRRDNIRAFSRDIALGNIARTTGLSVETVKNMASGTLPSGEETALQSRYEVSEDSQTKVGDSNVSIKGIASIKNGRMMLALEDGSTIDAADISFGTQDEALVYEAVANLEGIIDTDTASKLAKHLLKLGNATSEVFAKGIVQAYTYGYYGYGRESLNGDSTLSATLTEKQRNVAYGLGEMYSKAKIEADQENAKKATVVKNVPTDDKRMATAPDGTQYKNVRFKGKVNKWGKKQKAEVEFIDFIASNFSGNTVYVYESYRNKDGKYVYEDVDGKIHDAPNGRYNTSSGDIYIDLNAGSRGEGLVMNVFAHELYHHIKKRSPAKAKALAQFLVKEHGYESVEAAVQRQIDKAKNAGHGIAFLMKEYKLSRNAAERMLYDRAFEDFVADSLETMFTEGDAVGKLQRLKSQDAGLVNAIKNFIDKWIKKLRKFYSTHSTLSVEGGMVAQFEKFEQIQQMFVEALVDAGENYQASLTPGEEGTVINDNGDPVAHATQDGTVQLSLRTYEEGGRSAFRNYLQQCVSSNRLTAAEMQEMIDGIEEIYQVCKEFKDKYAPFGTWSDAAVVRDTYGKPVFSVVTPNGDYKMNLDFSLVCKKRRTLDAVFNEMSKRGIIDDFELGQKTVVKINEIVRKYGFETACPLCYVDSKRFRQASVADSFTDLYNELVCSLVPEDQKGSIEYFNFAGNATIKKVDDGIHTWSASELDFSHIDHVLDTYGEKTVEYKAAKYIKAHPEGRRLLLRGDFMSSTGFDAVKVQNKDILKLYNAKKGAGGPKAAFGDVQYMNEIIQKAKSWTPKKAYSVGGVRIQSFSDYVPRMVFDYVQMVYDLAATQLPAHAYTKEKLFVMQFGLTGIKINMSLIPAIAEGGIAAGLDANGNYVWAGESFDYETAKEIQNTEGYTENCGTICVGVSYAHIVKLLSDPNIRMVIPYHKSGLNPVVAHMNKIAGFTDYSTLKTNPGGCQSTIDKDGSKVQKDFDFYRALSRTGDPRTAANEYLAWCDSNGYTAKFNEFRWHENYYKLLTDFTLYDKDGNYVPQRAVRAVFPAPDSAFGSMKELIRSGLEEDAVIEGKRDKRLSAIVDEIQRTIPRTEAEIEESPVDQADRDLEGDFRFSDRDITEDPLYPDTERERSAFNRSFINKTTSLKPGEEKDIIIITADYVYVVRACGASGLNPYVGEILGKEFLDDDYLSEAREELKHGVNKHRERNDSPTQTIRYNRRRGHVSYRSVKERLKAEGNDYLLADEPDGDSEGDRGQSGRDPQGLKAGFSDRDSDSVSNRALLADAIESIAKEGDERNLIRNYKSILRMIDAEQKKLTEVRRKAQEIRFTKGRTAEDTKQMRELDAEAKRIAKRIDSYDRELLKIEAMKPIKDFLERAKKAAYKRAELKGKEALEASRIEAEVRHSEVLRDYREARDALRQQQSDTSVMEEEFIRLVKAFERQEKRSATQSGKDAQTITKLRAALKEESKKHRTDQKTWEREFARLLREYEAAGSRIDQLEAKIEAQKKAAKKKAEKVRETAEKRDAKAKLQKLVLDTVAWLTRPKKTDVKCPDVLKKPYADFLSSIDMSSERLANGGDPTKNDLRLTNAMGSLATALERIMDSQDPSQDTTAVLDTGYLDLPANFVQALRDVTEKVKEKMVEGEYVINNMTAEEVRNLVKMIRTLNHAIREVSTLYANLRFANVEELGKDSMSFMETLGKIQKSGGIKDFVQWTNALPYYAFKRFGDGGESIFEGLMDAQDKLAFLAEKIFAFQKQTWTGKEAKEWSKDVHTIDLPSGKQLTLTTADAMSIYCLSRRQQGLKHLLGGGVRVMGLQKGSQKAKDSYSTLTIRDIDAISSSLTSRQKKVAEAIQEFMSTTCAEWGNEISMKRFLTREFVEKFYFPIESNDQNLPAKDPALQQSDLFRLLNISATKPTDDRANNEVIIRNVFDVFTGHASDMARLNAYGMALLDYMKWLNYREKTTNSAGQVEERGVRKCMEAAFGAAAKSYVLNLIKDVNGRPSDNPLPGFYTRLVRNTKTAMVGSSLRVATLQVTSYPRASLVLSPKSLALGLTRIPNIERAKKYCGIALWKSFGFYDTDISHSIEDQMKGVKDVRQKIIELSLKGAEIGDAITWGALWNACEYEVASTEKYKVGTEEFYQAVGKKLREVVYRTQVVDSTLTRSEMMRSKNAKAQELSAFMSEPTLSANILMDAGMEFNMEKRRNGVKSAWHKTGKYVSRAVAVYSIGQLAAALMEGLWDAWRDDDDDEFSDKFLKAFTENLVLDLLPFNKIPILSEMAEGIMSLLGIGYFSADSLSSTAVSQSVSAVKAWSEVFSGETSTTCYNALYKTVRALSSFSGIPVGNAMREVVALWNNTAGAYDPTLKLLSYDRTEAELGNLLLDAMIEGNGRQAESIKAEFASVDDYQSAICAAVKNRFKSDEIDYDTAIEYLVNYAGVDEDNAFWKAEEWKYEGETDDEFKKYGEFFDAVQTGKDLKTVIKKYTDNGISKDSLASQISKHYKPIYANMSTSERAGIKGYLLNAYELCDVSREDAEEKLTYWAFLGEYPDCGLTESQASKYSSFAKPAGISITTYSNYCQKANGISGKDAKMAVIQSMPLTVSQKDALYYAEGWSSSKLYEAPWH